MPIVRIAGVSKAFGATRALDGIDLDIVSGEFLALLGASGCGKTTLLRLIAGFETPDAGRIEIDGRDMTGVPAYDRPVNMMFQSYALFPHMSVEQNVAYGLRGQGLSRAGTAARVAEMLDIAEIGNLARRRPDQLSGGQSQRVALARALARRPRLVLLDEPLAALDRKLRERTQFELVNIRERLGITFVVVTHDQAEAMTMASRVCVMDAGRIVQAGTPERVYETPNSRFVANFLGAANIFEGTVAGRDGDAVVVACPEIPSPVHVIDERPCDPGMPVAVMVRPEKLRTGADAAAAAVNTGRGIVREIAYLGDQSVYHVELPGGQRLRLSRANVRHTESGPISWDDEIDFHWHPGSAVLLDR